MNCYFDGSIGGASNEWMALGGFVATDGTWAFIEREWPKMLAHRTPSVSALHMTDLATGNGEFKLKNGWTDIEVNALIDDVIGFLGALDRSKYCAFVGPINIEDHKKLKSEGYVISPPAVICAEISLGSLFNWYRDAHKVELAHLFYDRNEPYIKSIRSRWLQFNRRGRVTTELFWSTIASVQPVVSKDSPGVQKLASVLGEPREQKDPRTPLLKSTSARLEFFP